ncbi:MAG: NAD(P)-dependent glycerol-3-phosphate dehydrogenase [Gemmatimonadetes bacterium]|nr:NAD(P)-dependent glycerol-3-phosphate dehydrogenase [Gemmatimonadota bacterium]
MNAWADSGGEAVAVVGAGSWGTALADLLARSGRSVRLWCREPEVAEEISREGVNRMFFDGHRLDRVNLTATSDLEQALRGAGRVVWVCPAQHTRALLERAAAFFTDRPLIVSGTKGIEVATLSRMDQVFADVLGPESSGRFAVLSGPSFAAEVARGVPTAVVVAALDADDRSEAQALFQTDRFRVYTNPDVVGVEMGGALKNVIAVAAGVVTGLDMGHNTVAALITRGLAEMTRLGTSMGAEAATFSGLAGMGDLVLTCTGALSRNRTVGERLGRGESVQAVLEGSKSVAEGVATARAVQALAQRQDVEMPISEEVYRILVEGADPRDAVQRLMTRAPKSEVWA